MRLWPGKPFPLGPKWDGQGTNFSFFSEHAERVELCLFDADDREQRYELRSEPPSTGTATCPGWGLDNATASACMDGGRPSRGTASTRASC